MSEIATGKLVIWMRLQAKRRSIDSLFTPDGNSTSIMLSAAADRLESQEQTIAALTARAEKAEAREKAAIADMKLIADNVRETHCDETCCFACAGRRWKRLRTLLKDCYISDEKGL